MSYTITYTNATSVDLTASSVTLNATGTATGSVSVSGGTTTTPTVTISSITGNGTLGISIAAGTASNSAGTAGAAGPSATFTVANATPTLSISAPSTNSTKSGPVSYTITYTSATSVDLTASSVTLDATGTAVGTVSVSNPTSTTPTVTISSISGSGTLGITIAAGTASNAAGPAPSSGPSATFNVSEVAPVVTITSPTSSSTITRNCSSLSIAGAAVDSTGIVSVSWSLGGGVNGVCTGTTSWSASDIALSSGQNVLTVTATDTLGNIGAATLTVTYTDAQPGNAWQGVAMVSLPIIPDDTDPEEAVGFTGNFWYEYVSSSGEYLGYSDQATWFTTPSATPGRGFWASFQSGTTTQVCGTIPAQNQPQTIHLYAGWNLIGQPFISSVTWDVSAIKVVTTAGTNPVPLEDAPQAVADYAWGRNPVNNEYYLIMDSNYAPTTVGTLAPWQAYWIYAYMDCDLVLPAP